jgi:hypothetical protein
MLCGLSVRMPLWAVFCLAQHANCIAFTAHVSSLEKMIPCSHSISFMANTSLISYTGSLKRTFHSPLAPWAV